MTVEKLKRKITRLHRKFAGSAPKIFLPRKLCAQDFHKSLLLKDLFALKPVSFPFNLLEKGENEKKSWKSDSHAEKTVE